jgi:MFS family permease
MSALLVASYTFGTLSDKIGRKKTSFIALLMVAVGILTSSFMPEYISFTVVRFITGFGKYTSTFLIEFYKTMKNTRKIIFRFIGSVRDSVYPEC